MDGPLPGLHGDEEKGVSFVPGQKRRGRFSKKKGKLFPAAGKASGRPGGLKFLDFKMWMEGKEGN